ncbi:hypothetical protein EKO27_g5484 [Xylaria grammica]|uniref:Uncharacterized protein n=1 Tax=Xylaria grammica TaxID=363999 RepID=A0A439D5E3_9PEZI|nr:hypothetical protein EKO27_g5484 [Xylaria grammica]
MPTYSHILFWKKGRKENPGRFLSGKNNSDSPKTPTTVPAPAPNVDPGLALSRSPEKGNINFKAPKEPQDPGEPNTVIASSQSKADSWLDVGPDPGYKVTALDPGRTFPTLSGSYGAPVHAQNDEIKRMTSNRFEDPSSAIRTLPSRSTKLPQQYAIELSADEKKDKHVAHIPTEIGQSLETSSKEPEAELGTPDDNRSTHDQTQVLGSLRSDNTTAYQYPNDDELHMDGSYQVSKTQAEGQSRMGTGIGSADIPVDMTPAQASVDCKEPPQSDREILATGGEKNTTTQLQDRSISALSQDTDPNKEELILLKKEHDSLVKENQTLRSFEQKCDILLDEQRGVDQIKIRVLTHKLEHMEEEIQLERRDAQREMQKILQAIAALRQDSDNYQRKFRLAESELMNKERAIIETRNRLRECKEQLDHCSGENHRLKSSIDLAQKDLDEAKVKHVEEVSHLNKAHKHNINLLEQDKRDIASKAQKDLEMVNFRHKEEVLHLNEEYKRATDALTSKFQDEMSIKTQNMQAIIDEKSRAIAAQDLRMASYNKQIHGVTSDSELGHKFRDLSLMIDSLVDILPRPQEYAVDTTLDPNNFLERNSSRRSRAWHKFLRNTCWDVLIMGFFQRQPGFGSFGCQGDGYATLLHLYRLFTKSNGQDTSNLKASFPNNRVANSWRASLFQAILSEVTSTVNDPTVTGFSAFFRGNVRMVTNDFVKTLQRVCQGSLEPRCSKIIVKLCHEVGILSLQMGAQQSVIILETCHYKDWVRSGEAFKDDNHYGGVELQVDIMVKPCLKRIGDGAQDFTTEKVLVIGDVVSLQAGGGD